MWEQVVKNKTFQNNALTPQQQQINAVSKKLNICEVVLFYNIVMMY